MEKLKKPKMERFCQIIALEDCEVAEACFRAGYGKDTHTTKDQYHITMGSRLMNRRDVQQRISTIRELNRENDKDYVTSMIERLKKIVAFDEGQYLNSKNVELKNGRTVTDFYFSKPIQDWDREDRALMINGFDVYGHPKFIDKQWAWEQLFKFYGLYDKKNNDIEDLIGVLTKGTLPIMSPTDISTLSSSDIKEIEEETSEDK